MEMGMLLSVGTAIPAPAPETETTGPSLPKQYTRCAMSPCVAMAEDTPRTKCEACSRRVCDSSHHVRYDSWEHPKHRFCARCAYACDRCENAVVKLPILKGVAIWCRDPVKSLVCIRCALLIQCQIEAELNELDEEEENLHNWRRVAMLVAFVRANRDNALRRSVLPLIRSITALLC